VVFQYPYFSLNPHLRVRDIIDEPLARQSRRAHRSADDGRSSRLHRRSPPHGHSRGSPLRGKIERWHQTLKNRILLENYFLPSDLEAQINAFIVDYNHRRYHESIDNLAPADATSAAAQPFWQNEKGSNYKPLPTAACSTSCTPPDFTNPMS
jgi:transposase InsO family protein